MSSVCRVVCILQCWLLLWAEQLELLGGTQKDLCCQDSSVHARPALIQATRLSFVLQEGGEEKSAKQEKDEMIMGLLLEEVLPKAATLYMAGPLQVTAHT